MSVFGHKSTKTQRNIKSFDNIFQNLKFQLRDEE